MNSGITWTQSSEMVAVALRLPSEASGAFRDLMS